MRIALAALGFVNKDINHNKMVMIDTLNNLKNKVDIVLFGEAFLQGFDSLSFDYEKDKYSPVLLICIALLFVRCTEQSSTGRNSGRLLLVGRNTGEILRKRSI